MVRSPKYLRLFRLTAIVGVIISWDWMAGIIINFAAFRHGAFVSELSASTQPFADFFRYFDAFSGTLLVVAAVFWLLSMTKSPIRTVAAAVFALCGIANIVDSLLPLQCASTLERRCQVLESTGRVGVVHQLHLYESLGLTTLIVALAGWAGLVLYRKHREKGFVFYTAGLMVVTAVWVADTSYRYFYDLTGYGFMQQLFLTTYGIWLILLAVLLGRRSQYQDKQPARTKSASS
jgi:hypothetical protein